MEGKSICVDKNLKIFIITDIHYLADSLKDTGKAFTEFNETGDGKLTEYSKEIMEALKRDIKNEAVDILLVAGDLTLNGEKESHLELVSYFSEIKFIGTDVYVIPGNHDIDNEYAVSFKGDKQEKIESISSQEFAEIYKEFGYSNVIERDPNSLSYLVKIRENFYFLMLDTNKYEESKEKLGYQGSGVIKKETIKWIEDTLKSRTEDDFIISVMHHNLMDHNEMFYRGYTLDNNDEILDLFKKMGIRLNFSGHIHIQNIKEKEGIVDIVTGSLAVYPQRYGYIQYEAESRSITYKTQWIDIIGWAKENNRQDQNLLNFQEYSKSVMEQKFSHMVLKEFKDNGNYTYEELNSMICFMKMLSVALFSGEAIDQSVRELEGYRLWQNCDIQFIKKYIETTIKGDTDSNTFMIP